MEEAIFLTKFADKVTLVHRREEFRASQIMEDRARANDKIEFVTNAVVDEVLGENSVTGVTIRDVNTDERTELPADGLFVAIGHDEHEALRRAAGARRRRLHHHEAGLHRDERRGRLRGRRRRRPHVPAGGHRRRDGLHDGARRRALARGP